MFTSIDEVLQRPIECTLTTAVGVMDERAAGLRRASAMCSAVNGRSVRK
jgi:hypothetical protein